MMHGAFLGVSLRLCVVFGIRPRAAGFVLEYRSKVLEQENRRAPRFREWTYRWSGQVLARSSHRSVM